MIFEAISFSFNLGVFTCLFWNFFSFQDKKLVEKLKRLPLFIAFGFLFYSIFYISTLFSTRFFELKSIYFNAYTILFFLLAVSLLLYLAKSFSLAASLASLLIAPYIFFLLFGFEEFTFSENKIYSYSLLKTQNPMIGLISLCLILIKPVKIQIPLFAIAVGYLFYIILPLKEFPYPEIKILHYKYIPYEFFMEEKSYLFEENSGIYTEKKEGVDDKLYKFSMKSLKKINLPLRQTIQYLISSFDFPILLSDENSITLIEMSRSYNDTFFKVVFHINKNPVGIEVIGNEQIDSATIEFEGPLF